MKWLKRVKKLIWPKISLFYKLMVEFKREYFPVNRTYFAFLFCTPIASHFNLDYFQKLKTALF